MGRQQGYNHAGSGLYEHILRLIDELLPSVVFLENVPAILRLGMKRVAESLTQRGFEIRWCVLTGSIRVVFT